MKPKRILLIIIGAILLICIGTIVAHYEKVINGLNKDNTKFINAMNDTVTHYITKNGESAAKILALEESDYKKFISINFKDSLITELQKRVAYYKGKAESVTNFDAIGNVSGSSVTMIDSTFISDCDSLFPIYTSNYKDDWINLTTRASRDSTSFNLNYKDTYTISQLNDKNGDYVEIINQSPYVLVDNIRTFRIKQPTYKAKKWGVGIQTGFGAFVDLSNKNLGYGPYIGIGISYNIIRF